MRIGSAALAACVACLPLLTAGCKKTETASPVAEIRPPAAVGIAPVKGVDEPIIVEATGSFQADESSDVAPDSTGRVVATPVDVGQHVSRGAVLIRIQAVDAELRLEEARASVQRAEANLKLAESQNALAQTTARRSDALLKGGLIPQTTADEARTQYQKMLPVMAPAVAAPITPGRPSAPCPARMPASGRITSEGMGGKSVSSSISRKTPP